MSITFYRKVFHIIKDTSNITLDYKYSSLNRNYITARSLLQRQSSAEKSFGILLVTVWYIVSSFYYFHSPTYEFLIPFHTTYVTVLLCHIIKSLLTLNKSYEIWNLCKKGLIK